MNMIIYEAEEIEKDSTLTLRDRRCAHINTILKAAAGQTLRVGQVNGSTGTGTIVAISRHEIVLAIKTEDNIPAQPPVDLILGMPRPIMLKRVLGQAAALGVAKIFLINANRVEKSFFSASLLQSDAMRPYLLQGLEQAMATHLPVVSIHPRFKPFAEDQLPTISRHCPVRIVPHPDAAMPLVEAVPIPLRDRVLLAVGPEGGWIDYEVELFRKTGMIPVTMGQRILRVDTAVPALLGQLDLLRSIPG